MTTCPILIIGDKSPPVPPRIRFWLDMNGSAVMLRAQHDHDTHYQTLAVINPATDDAPMSMTLKRLHASELLTAFGIAKGELMPTVNEPAPPMLPQAPPAPVRQPGALSTAITIATRIHSGKTDKAGEPYILHPLRVMLACTTMTERIVAVLHDVIEDAVDPDATRAELNRLFNPDILAAVEALTKRPGEIYDTFIDRCAANPLAKTVKIADIKDNMGAERLKLLPGDEANRRYYKYAAALERLGA